MVRSRYVFNKNLFCIIVQNVGSTETREIILIMPPILKGNVIRMNVLPFMESLTLNNN